MMPSDSKFCLRSRVNRLVVAATRILKSSCIQAIALPRYFHSIRGRPNRSLLTRWPKIWSRPWNNSPMARWCPIVQSWRWTTKYSFRRKWIRHCRMPPWIESTLTLMSYCSWWDNSSKVMRLILSFLSGQANVSTSKVSKEVSLTNRIAARRKSR